MSKRFPLGIQDFELLRNEGLFYLDKTEKIYELLQFSQRNFLSRPRRFGKSLLLSTLKCIFQGKKELFKGLWIEDKMEWESYPVIHFSFSSISYHEKGLENAILSELNKIAEKHEITLTETVVGQCFRELITKLHRGEKRVVILIDEYDKPIIDFLDDLPKARENQRILKLFYAVLKDSDPHIQFLLITGVSKFSKVSIFSDLNNLTDLTLLSRFSTLLGYTQKELEANFSEEIETIAQQSNLSKTQLTQKIKAFYNGYSWDGKSFVYNPVSVHSYFSSQQFHNFWFATGTPTFLIKLLRKRNQIELEGNRVSYEVFESYNIENLETLSLLFQTGYLTIKSIDKRGQYVLAYPNQEVKRSMLSHLVGSFRHTDSAVTQALVFDIQDAFEANDLELVIKFINSIFKSIPSHIFIKKKEAYYHSLIFLIFNYLGQFMEAEVHTSDGRIDAVVENESHVYLLEFKLDKNAKEALAQIVEKDYAAKYPSKLVVGVGINFSSETKSVGDWEVKEL